MLPIIEFNNILDRIAKNSKKKLTVSIMLDSRLCKTIFNTNVCNTDVNTLKTWKKHFVNKPEYQVTSVKQVVSKSGNSLIVSSGTEIKSIKSVKYQVDKLPVVFNLYTATKHKHVSGNSFNVYKNIYSKIMGNWKIQLVLEKTYVKKPRYKNKVNWDNNDSIYVEIQYIKPLSSFTKIHLTELKSHLTQFLSKSGGVDDASYNSSRNAKRYITDLASSSIKPNRPFQHLSDIFNTPKLINRTEYFDLLTDIDKNTYCINNNYSGVEYIIVIDSKKSSVYYATKSYVDTNVLMANCGVCIISAVKHRETYIIRRVIVDNGVSINDSTTKQINARNKKFGEILNTKFVTYDTISSKTYKKCIALYKTMVRGNIDFIEFSRVDLPFSKNNIYQWSPKQLPITFYCRECPSSYLTEYPKPPKNQILYILFLTINGMDLKSTGLKKLPYHNELFGSSGGYLSPIQFSPSTFPNAFLFYSGIPNLNKQYISLVFDYKKTEWEFVEKADMSYTGLYGDDFKDTELNVWNAYRNPVSFSDLVLDKSKISDQMYFVAHKSKMHEAPIKLNNFGKMSLINQYTSASATVIDLASGRASDLMTYRYARVHKLLFCEIDKDAVDVTLQRKYKFENPNNTPLFIFNTNLNDTYKTNLAQIQQNYTHGKVSNVFCFFALHYITDTLARIKNISALISCVLDKGGEFVFTAFDGDSIIQLLDKHNGKWEVSEKGKKKYSIISKYKKSDINTPKRSIKLILPFNVNTHYYDENLINDRILDREFKSRGLNVVREGNFMEFSDKFRDKKSHFYNSLTDADKTFVGLYRFKVYKKK
jgi:hypothetical protein